MVDSGRAVIGTPEDAIAQIERLASKTGDFGCLLLLAHNWADFERTKNSYELFARHVLPVINDANAWRAGVARPTTRTTSRSCSARPARR